MVNSTLISGLLLYYGCPKPHSKSLYISFAVCDLKTNINRF